MASSGSSSRSLGSASHVGDDRVAELRCPHLGGVVCQPGKVVCDGLGRDGSLQAVDDQVRGLVPAEVSQHHLPGKDDRPRVDLVLTGVLGGGPVGGLEDGYSRVVVDVASRGNADATYLRRKSIGEVITVEVGGGDHVVVAGPGKNLLQHCVGDDILDQEFVPGVAA